MKTVVQVVQHLKPGGIETMALDLQKYKLESEQVFIVSLEGKLQESLEQWPRLKEFSDHLIFLDKPDGFDFKTVFKLRDLFRKMKVDSVHTHHVGPLFYGGIAARIAGIKQIIHTEHDAWHLESPKRAKMMKRLIKFVKPIVVADANIVSNVVQNKLKIEAPRVILNGINTLRFKPKNKTQARKKFGLPLNKKIIGCSGRLEKVKGQDNLIDAIYSLPEKYHLAIAGTGSLEKSLKDHTRELGLNDRVHFLGLVDDMPEFYSSLDLFCLPSLNEGFPLSTLEAQACGVRSIASDVGGSRETLCPKSGKLIATQGRLSIKRAILELMSDDKRYDPRAFVVKNADVAKMAKSYASLRLDSYKVHKNGG